MEITTSLTDQIAKDIQDAGQSGLRKKKALLRELYPLVIDAKKNDFTNKVIIQILARRGLIFSENSFAVTMHRIKKEIERESKSTPASLSAPAENQSKLSCAIASAKSRSEVGQKQVVKLVATSSGKRKSILRIDKGVFGELDPSPADGVVDLKQK